MPTDKLVKHIQSVLDVRLFDSLVVGKEFLKLRRLEQIQLTGVVLDDVHEALFDYLRVAEQDFPGGVEDNGLAILDSDNRRRGMSCSRRGLPRTKTRVSGWRRWTCAGRVRRRCWMRRGGARPCGGL